MSKTIRPCDARILTFGAEGLVQTQGVHGALDRPGQAKIDPRGTFPL